ncbi:hypothetical protein AKJ38_03610 [candidate division MSBL1 archaeon SCGC-AAA259I14]|uniref:Aldehyde ferredoxin oxidoreductase N-terminal domain-containing protein n=1 Tax=candidate division MSBL1 archaeon SCGC-AAA259I14 TaxID=1698268 RepID=A0A133UPS9_9EURY|nr:hypothetical protein AKJ38_03610 [candidate division MSBL1 archaeon SCGC-AAA259I14]
MPRGRIKNRNNDIYGWSGNTVWIDLNREKIIRKDLQFSRCLKFLGGAGINAKILYEKTNQNTKPLGSENIVCFGVGPFVGTPAPSSARLEVTTKSPLTGIFGDSNAGGAFGVELKLAGYDHLVFQGSCKELNYLLIDDTEIELKKAGNLQGRTTFDTVDILKERHGTDIRTACVGPAAENGVLYGNILLGKDRCLGRSGTGSVLASKGIKAIVVRGSDSIKMRHPEEVKEVSEEILKRIKANPFYELCSKLGTLLAMDVENKQGKTSLMNFQDLGVPEKIYRNISGESIEKRIKVGDYSCFNCPLHCGNIWEFEKDSTNLQAERIELSTVTSWGPNLGIFDLETIGDLFLKNQALGMDEKEFSAAISLVMECFQRGIISEKDVGGTDIRWGKSESVKEMLDKTANMRGFGRILALGSKSVAEYIGKEAEKYLMTVKGQAIPCSSPRNAMSWGLGYATSTRGGDHLKAFPTIENAENQEFVKDLINLNKEAFDPTSPEGKGKIVAWCENYSAVQDSLGLCRFPYTWLGFGPKPVSPNLVAKLFSKTTGIELNGNELMKCGERIYNLEKCYNVLMGMGIEDDTLPQRCLREPAPSGPREGRTLKEEFEEMLEEYYKSRNWNIETGRPNSEKLNELGLQEVRAGLNRRSLL